MNIRFTDGSRWYLMLHYDASALTIEIWLLILLLGLLGSSASIAFIYSHFIRKDLRLAQIDLANHPISVRLIQRLLLLGSLTSDIC